MRKTDAAPKLATRNRVLHLDHTDIRFLRFAQQIGAPKTTPPRKRAFNAHEKIGISAQTAASRAFPFFATRSVALQWFAEMAESDWMV